MLLDGYMRHIIVIYEKSLGVTIAKGLVAHAKLGISIISF